MGNFIPSFKNWNWAESVAENCNIYANYRRTKNGTGSFFGTSVIGFEGIPQNFVFNLLGWLALVCLFIVLRKKAWNYGRIAVMQKEEMKWTDMFYVENKNDPDAEHNAAIYTRASGPAGPPPDYDNPDDLIDSKLRVSTTPSDRQSVMFFPNLQYTKANEIEDRGYFSWIKLIFTLKDSQFKEKCGQDCVYYLSFQRHLIFLASVIMLCSLIIILPINMQKNYDEKAQDSDYRTQFSDTSIINLDKRHNFIWAHIILAIGFLFLSIATMRHFSTELQFIDEDKPLRSVMIIGINRDKCAEDILAQHLSEIYPEADITEISFAYDISHLNRLEFSRLSATSAKLYWQDIFDKTKKRPLMRPYHCGIVACWCERCGCEKTDAISYYTEREKTFIEKVELEKQLALGRPVGIAFVTFNSLDTAERIVEDYAFSARLFLHTPKTEHSESLNAAQWIVKYAPIPEDINWESLTLDYKYWYLRFFLVNGSLGVITVIFTTPVYMFTMLSAPKNFTALAEIHSSDVPVLTGVIVDTLPTMVMWIIGVVLINAVSLSDMIIGFWTKTAGNLSEMIKVFLYLTFMVVILPSLGVTSLSFMLHQSRGLRWSCIFFKENGALFVNYVCTSTFVGAASELMRLPELFKYSIKLLYARSSAEIGAIRKSILSEFQIGSQYAWMMLHFGIFTCFSVIYPLVTPFGFAYLCMRHLVDRYNIYFAYAACKVEKGVHGTAVNLVILCMFMLQINLLAFVHFHLGASSLLSESSIGQQSQLNPEIRTLQVVSVIAFAVTAAIFLGQLCFNVCADFSPITHFKSIPIVVEETEDVQNQNPDTPMVTVEQADDSNIIISPIIEGDPTPQTKIQQIIFSPEPTPILVHLLNPAVMYPVVYPGTTEGSNISEKDKPYGRYIPPLLRSEFIRLHNEQLQQQNNEQMQPCTDENLGNTENNPDVA